MQNLFEFFFENEEEKNKMLCDLYEAGDESRKAVQTRNDSNVLPFNSVCMSILNVKEEAFRTCQLSAL